MEICTEPFIAIIGGGLAGLTLSIGLTRQGIPHKIYEAASAFAEIGAGIALAPNSIKALELIDPRMKDALRKCITYNEGIDDDGEGPGKEEWLDIRVGEAQEFNKSITTIYHKGSSKPSRACVHRAKFLNEFVKLVPASITEFGKSLVSISEAASSSKLCLKFADGSSIQATAVVACDGIKSVVRQQYVLADIDDKRVLRPAFTNDFVYRGLFPRAKFLEISSNLLNAGKGTVFCGQDGYIIAYPVDKGRLINVVASKHIKCPSADTLAQHETNWTQAVTTEEMLSDFEDWGAPLKNILSHIERPERWALYDHLPAPTYVKGRVALMGDAAHATTPHQGQGAGMGFEDSFILSSILGEVLNESEKNSANSSREVPEDLTRDAKIEACFRAYDEVRRKRTQEVTRTSREAMEIWGFSGKGIGRDFEKIKENLDVRMKWMWDVDLLSEVKRGVDIAGKSLHMGA
ncbi:hypothetical protein ONS95_012616 [Cadophora gregata]|uniref:uncharacterized protein n=1 Tax=Cadophora gregata TaxID=51156 RepID=UPI0026DC2C5E|nr:uncharacterized protein ONS95_012616 [Cadophora gregata]KAK0118322.1 hypothetical protein ONS95_012616 [Cadophora gregata]KAK0123390.1 hypothetical protein ONS96_010381 [Cadophora gregata f. sp. sojae]